MIKKLLFLLLMFFTLAANGKPGLLESLGLGNEETPLDVDEAFVFSAERVDPVTLLAQWQIAEGNYLYRDKINITLTDTDGKVHLLPYTLPEGESKMDEIFGLSEVYHHDTQILLPLDRDNVARTVTLKVSYQGCSETFNICYPPVQKQVTLDLPAIDAAAASTEVSTSTVGSEQDRIAQRLAEDNLLQVILSFLGLGLLLSFTPCVFPMIPILSSIIVGEGDHITTRRAFVLSLTYVLAMSITYTAAGVMTGLLGENLQAMLQNPWVIVSFSAIFVVLALSMFGLYEIHIPHALQHHLHQFSHRQQGGTLFGVAVMGLLSGLIVGPCLAPPLAGALIFIGQSADPLLGGLALFSLSMGMGIPLLIIGTSAGSLLPRAGNWMHTVKAVFGVMMLGLAIWMLERILPAWIIMLLWSALFIITAVYLGAITRLSADASGWQKLWKGLGLVMLAYGILLMIGATSGSHNPLQPLHGLRMGQSEAAAARLKFTQVTNLAELQQQLNNTTQPVMLDFYADWCVECKVMEETTFRDPAVLAALSSYTLLQLDMTLNNDAHKAMLKQLQVFGPPTMLFFNAQGQEYRQQRLVGKVSAETMLRHLAGLGKNPSK
jgi:thiol:disulfide interchange protein DsbD